jgi:hypothetical protein
MKQNQILTNFSPRALLLFCISAFLLSACSTTSNTTSSTTSSTTSTQRPFNNNTNIDGNTTPGTELAQALPEPLSKLEKAIAEQQWATASNNHLDILPERLTDQQFALYSLLSAQLSQHMGRNDEAIGYLSSTRLYSIINLLDISLQYKLVSENATLQALEGLYENSMHTRIYISPLLPQEDFDDNQLRIWQTANSLSTDELQSIQQRFKPENNNTIQGDDEFQGWIELALLNKSHQEDLDKQLVQLNNWREKHPSHSAASALPAGIALIQELAENRPQHIALLLPLQGRFAKAGQAVLDGFLAAHFQQRSPLYSPKISIYDSSQSEDINELYQTIVASGADFILGPLEKNKARSLFDIGDLNTPTLALNYISDYGTPPLGLYQFGLAIDDETKLIAGMARINHAQRAMILGPQTNWAQRGAEAFKNHWHRYGGSVVAEGYYEAGSISSPSKTVRSLFEIDRSDARLRKIKALSGLKLEFEPRRRQDIDMILMLGNAEQARSTKPLFAFHYGADIPVYSSSQIHQYSSPGKNNKDLNGTQFSEIPWLLANNDIFLKQLDKAEKTSPYIRMHALGLDSYFIIPRLQQLQHHKDSMYFGRTGNLSISQEQRITRQLAWARFSRNKAVQTDIPADTDSLLQTLTRQNTDNTMPDTKHLGQGLQEQDNDDGDIHAQEQAR